MKEGRQSSRRGNSHQPCRVVRREGLLSGFRPNSEVQLRVVRSEAGMEEREELPTRALTIPSAVHPEVSAHRLSARSRDLSRDETLPLATLLMLFLMNLFAATPSACLRRLASGSAWGVEEATGADRPLEPEGPRAVVPCLRTIASSAAAIAGGASRAAAGSPARPSTSQRWSLEHKSSKYKRSSVSWPSSKSSPSDADAKPR